MQTQDDMMQMQTIYEIMNRYQYLLLDQERAEEYVKQHIDESIRLGITMTKQQKQHLDIMMNPINDEIKKFTSTVEFLDNIIVEITENSYVSALVKFPQKSEFNAWLQDVYYTGIKTLSPVTVDTVMTSMVKNK